MRPIDAIIVSAACLTLGACSISVDDDGVYSGGDHHRGGRDYVSVTLPSGDKDRLRCPNEMDIFVVDSTAQGKGLIYGCRSRDAALPSAE